MLIWTFKFGDVGRLSREQKYEIKKMVKKPYQNMVETIQ